MRPTFAKRDILAKLVAKSGISAIFSRNTLEHLGEAVIVEVYNSQNVNFPMAPRASVMENWGGVNTACLSSNIAWRRSYWISSRDNGSASAR